MSPSKTRHNLHMLHEYSYSSLLFFQLFGIPFVLVFHTFSTPNHILRTIKKENKKKKREKFILSYKLLHKLFLTWLHFIKSRNHIPSSSLTNTAVLFLFMRNEKMVQIKWNKEKIVISWDLLQFFLVFCTFFLFPVGEISCMYGESETKEKMLFTILCFTIPNKKNILLKRNLYRFVKYKWEILRFFWYILQIKKNFKWSFSCFRTSSRLSFSLLSFHFFFFWSTVAILFLRLYQVFH